jgi:endogenous inhibitor of DNA gyrase (YacG/DUF329 family)
MAKRIKSLRCPECRTIVQTKDEHFPFCSDRCRTIDLGKWASGVYKVSSPINDPEVLDLLESGALSEQNDRKQPS